MSDMQVPKKLKRKTPECDVCGIEVIFNLHIYNITGMCGACSTGESRLNYEED
jgi:ribosomal protein S27AE